MARKKSKGWKWGKILKPDEREPLDRPTHLMYFLDPTDVPIIITREEWGALPFTSSDHVNIPYTYVRFQCTGPDICTSKEECIKYVQDMQKDHMDNLKLPDIQFNFLVSPEGHIFEGRGWFRDAFRPGKHDLPWKNDFINIGFIGDYRAGPIPMKMEAATIELLTYAWRNEYFTNEPIPLSHKIGNVDFTFFH